MIIHPHLHLESLPDESHLMGPILGRQELLPLLLTDGTDLEVDGLVGGPWLGLALQTAAGVSRSWMVLVMGQF